jgi:uncharacterized protein YcbK (DUF882 family)
MSWTRRRLLQMGGALAGMSAAGVLALPARAAGAPASAGRRAAAKRIHLKNLHTGEELETEFFRGDAYVGESLASIQVLLRDFRNNQQHAIDPRLMDYLFDVAQHAGVDPVFSVISGYRSPQTNAQLRERGNGVARHSLHLEGRAIDVRLAGVACDVLAARALDLTQGGVGYYRQSDFVHLDTGAFRTWKG